MTEQQTNYQALYEEALNGWYREASEEETRFIQARYSVAEPHEWPPNDANWTGVFPAPPADIEDGSWTIGRLHFQVDDGRLSITTDDGEEVWAS